MNKLPKIKISDSKEDSAELIAGWLKEKGYKIVETDTDRPWGMFFRIDNNQSDKFIQEFFSDIEIKKTEAGATPKILVHFPEKRNSWQFHKRRNEFWKFLTEGAYFKSKDDNPGEESQAKPMEIVSFDVEERHRLVGAKSNITIVAEIWQHLDSENPSDEDDITRVEDDFNRK
jgi:mannose-6-phosphate isomerase-like protein (cupin superfamily)